MAECVWLWLLSLQQMFAVVGEGEGRIGRERETEEGEAAMSHVRNDNNYCKKTVGFPAAAAVL